MKSKFSNIVKNIEQKIRSIYSKIMFSGSGNYWENRYASGGNSGKGSYGKFSIFKADLLNNFVKENKINSVTEFGCGDGNQSSLFKFPKYTGLDVSESALKICKELFKGDKTKNFDLYNPDKFDNKKFKSDLSLSLDVIYHLVEDEVFGKYMRDLFSSSNKFVIIYSSDTDINRGSVPHYKNREFSKWIKNNLKNWKLIKKISNPYPEESSADFFIFQHK